MNLINEMKKWRRERRGQPKRMAPVSETSDDFALARRMRAAAVEVRADGRARLRLEKRTRTRLSGLGRDVESFLATGGDGGAALDRLAQDMRIMESCAEQAALDATGALPACGGMPRILIAIDVLCGGGDIRINRDRLMLALASFDEVQALEMAELWAVPEAVRISLSRAYASAAESALTIARERRQAEAWVDGQSSRVPCQTPAFFEHALQLLAENGDSDRYACLERLLADADHSVEAIVARAHEQEAAVRVRLENILANKRMIDALNWQACFETLSCVEAELQYDPSGIYPAMEDDSRAAVRAEIAVIAKKLRLGEVTVARHAVKAAQQALQDGESEERRTVCYWLYDDAGRAELARRMGVPGAGIPLKIPDPTGRRSAWGLTLLAGVGCVAFWMGVPGILFAPLAIPLAWCAATALVGRFHPSMVKPAKLLKMEFRHVPDALRTLVVMPVLLSGEKRAQEICDQFEALGCLEKDDNIRYLILGDFADGDSPSDPQDEDIVECVRARIQEMNRRAGREQYYYLHRERRLLKADGRWMGRDRKRGALMDLNRLLLGENGAEEAFQVEGAACEKLRGKFRYVLTIDADTRFLPGSVKRLIGTLAHPLNARRMDRGCPRGFAVLQPQMEMMASACVNDYVRLFAGEGGLNTYPASVSNFWQDVTGTGIYGGKGLYDVRAFAEALDGALPEGRILSHDLIEGTLAGAALVSDECFYDGFPSTLGSFLKRHSRWIRGDWQLLPLLFSAKKYPPYGRRLGFAARIRLLDNLLRSLQAPALLALLIQGIWLGRGDAIIAGLLFAYWTPLLRLFRGGARQWRRATGELAILPATATCAMDAILRTLWRLFVTGKHLMDWVTSADSEGVPGGQALSCRVAAILLLPGLLYPQWLLAAVALGALFAVAPEWIRDMEQSAPEDAEAMDGEDAALLAGLARDIWRFFADCVTEQGHHLPPDNLQVDPATGTARRTSPTNIGLYLMSCASARALELISRDDMLARMRATLGEVEQMEKWKGHLYNWYEIDALRPLCPKYVSAVDSGNLAAALLVCASIVREEDATLAQRMWKLAEEMDFAALFDEERMLFSIGMDVEHDQLSGAHYDLLASESRILSYVSMMLGQTPLRHWSKLSRTAVPVAGGVALVSWSGTMFEYLMPELLMRTPVHSLLGGAERAAISAQQALGRAKGRPWGVSESGYYAFDLHLNYQYRAFGLKALSLGGVPEDVVAPYASLLALFAAPKSVAENVRAMAAAGWRGEYGFYEAVDYLAQDGRPRIVKSYMAHHQGMALCALCNALTDGALNRAFIRIPQARALELLLEERPAPRVRLSGRVQVRDGIRQPSEDRRDERTARPDRYLVDAHLLGGAGTSVLLTADGSAHYARKGIQGTRFGGDFLNRQDGACVHVRRERTGECIILGRQKTVYSPGEAVHHDVLGQVQIETRVCVSPEDGTLIKRIAMTNTARTTETVRVADCAPVALGSEAEMLAHPVFRHLFVESERIAQCALLFRRRPREAGESGPVLVHMVSTPGSIACQTDYEKLVGRMGSTLRPGGIRWEMDDATGTVLNPCSALQSAVTLEPGETAQLHFAMGLIEPEEMDRWVERNFAEATPERASQLSRMQAKAMLGFLGMDARRYRQLQRLSALLLDRHLALGDAPRGEAAACPRESLWGLGISGDLSLMLMHVENRREIACAREAIQAHEFYRTLGMQIDLVLVNEYGNDYDQPVRDALSDAVAFSHLNDMRGVPGGVHLLEGQSLTPEQRMALGRAAVVELNAAEDFGAQLRRRLAVLELPARETMQMRLGENHLTVMHMANGYGGFLADGRYAIDVLPDVTTPAPWANLMTNDHFGVLTTERGGGFLWAGNSRSGRLTSFVNDVLREGWGWMLYLVEEDTGAFARLLPGDCPQAPFRTLYAAKETVYRFETEELSAEVDLCVRSDAPEMRAHVTLRTSGSGKYRLVGFVDWLMGTDARDAAFVRTWTRDGACYAVGTARGTAYFAASNARASAGCDRSRFLGRGGILHPEGIVACSDRVGGWVLNVPVQVQADVPVREEFALGWAEDAQRAYARVRSFYANPSYEAVRTQAIGDWNARAGEIVVETPDLAVNQLANGWLLHQTLSSRVQGRTGLYQPGGAYGFRDQLQDMLSLLDSDPLRVRAHILRCAAHQFEDGDVMHWWHEPYLGVRTHISDDLLFLPYVAARYVRWTGDVSILSESVAYLENVEIPEGKEDLFAEMRPSGLKASLHDHCMRAFRRASATGAHGLIKMGSGDWNDGMNRVGAQGSGESIWLSEFLIVCAQTYAAIAPEPSDAAWLLALSEQIGAAVERHGWDGEWYLRAYTDSGEALGSHEGAVCRIDAISQAWAVLAGLDESRCRQAMDAAWRLLVDEQNGILRLLTPPFSLSALDPGYIRGYPEGVRENGAQYTHAACWLLLAWIRMGDAERAHRALKMLLPLNHADTKEKAEHYRVEPYVVAADVYDGIHAGRGGWTWYTGSAGWLYQCVLELMGFERQGSRVRMNALLGEWPEASITVRWGQARYRLVCRADVVHADCDGVALEDGWLELRDDGGVHEAHFPPRKGITTETKYAHDLQKQAE